MLYPSSMKLLDEISLKLDKLIEQSLKEREKDAK